MEQELQLSPHAVVHVPSPQELPQSWQQFALFSPHPVSQFPSPQ
jgi:hypothetical protein